MAEIDKKNGAAKMNWLFAPLGDMDEYRALREAVEKPGVVCVTGLDDSQRLHLLAALARETGRMLLFVTATDQLAQKATDDLLALMNGRVQLLPAREINFLRVAAASGDLAARRVEAMGAALAGGLRALVAPVDALMFRLMPPASFKRGVIKLQRGLVIEPKDLMAKLIDAGYERVDIVESRGQCALRGGIIDVFPVGRASALRLEFFDDELDMLREFDALTQRSTDEIERAWVLPANETLLTADEASAAAERILRALGRREEDEQRAGESAGNRQRAIEAQFGLTPWDDFAREISDALDELPSLDEMSADKAFSQAANKPAAPQGELEKQFLPRVEALRATRSCPAAESMMPYLYEQCACVMDYLKNPIVVLDQPDRLRTRCENRMLEFEEQFKVALERENALPGQAELLIGYDELLRRLTGGTAVATMPLAVSQPDLRFSGLFRFEGLSGGGYQSNMHELARDVKTWKKEGWRVGFLMGGAARGQRLSRTLEELGSPVPYAEDVSRLTPGIPLSTPYSLSRGFRYPAIKFAVITESDVYGSTRQRTRSSWKAGQKLEAFTDLKAGDFVVHESYGIGQYMGTERIQSDGVYNDYLLIRYQGSDRLYVPTDQLDRVQKYIGSEDAPPKLNRLSGSEWQKQKARVKADIDEIAEDLVQLYSERHDAQGFAFPPDTPWQREFEDKFPYEETDDQKRAIAEIKRDMEQPRPMDRLLCGDVGYGKTEVALRAIFKCVVEGKQAVLLAPTTILVQQHYQTILKRFSGYPIRVDMLSRFRTPAEQRATLEDIKTGAVDIVVGTHRLLGSDVSYADLGLLVIDEEQRFGVKHKEAIKKLKKNVDVLTLSATPIPRTLHMSMVGIRDMSLLRTPPEERYPVQNYVVEYSDELIRDAILRELGRDGQVYVLYNRVQSIERFYERLRRLVPEARVAIGHGQMREHALEDVMLDFYEGKYDVLLCTTIIEAGLDVPRANTLIVIDADRFGLAQLYQIRGRVGRSNRLAYAYLTVQPGKVLSENADKRLAAIREFTEFGAGFRVAMRDMEIRGTGNLLGNRQSGHMSAVGYDLYVKMIEESVRHLRGEAPPAGDVTTRMELRIDAYLPGDYVPSDKQRVEVYKKIAQINGSARRADVIDELIDRFGSPARPVMNLIDIAHLKGLCSRLGMDTVSLKGGKLAMRFAPDAKPDPNRLLEALSRHPNALMLSATVPAVLYFNAGAKSTEELIRLAIPVMEEIADALSPLESEEET
ncbi:MAG: transcription-repair coupling factor [Clostridiales bacterium]|nr:transcription-repair coupling factor [Clostridiales bacterium]